MTQPGRFFAERAPIDFAERSVNSLAENEALNGKTRVDWANAAIGTGLDMLDDFITYKENSPNKVAACAAANVSRIDQQFGTQAQVTRTFQFSTGAPAGTGTLNVNVSIPADQPGASGSGYYGGTFSPLHVVDGAGGHGGLDSPNTQAYDPDGHRFTSHIDSGNPSHGNVIGAGWHFLRDMSGLGGYRPCP